MVLGCSALIQILFATALALFPAILGERCTETRCTETRSLTLLQHKTTSKLQLHAAPQLNVALAVVVPYGALNNSEWRDGLAVMALSARKAAARSAHRTTLLAILPDGIPRKSEEERVLAKLGLKALFVPVPVPLDQVKNEFARRQLALVLGQFEQLKYYGAALTQYDRVVILDGDTMWRAPIDELFADAGGIRLQGIYDHDLDIECSSFPPLNTGFLVFTPDKRDFDALKSLVREGDFREGTGWEGSNTGWTYGTGSQGVLSFYYNQVRPGVKGYNPAKPTKGKDLPGMPFTKQPPTSRFRPLDRSVYNVIETKLLNDVISANHTDASRVKVFHFTGNCMKPWKCLPTGGGICEQMTEEWWSLRAELAEKWGGEAERCQPYKKYKVLPLPESEAI